MNERPRSRSAFIMLMLLILGAFAANFVAGSEGESMMKAGFVAVATVLTLLFAFGIPVQKKGKALPPPTPPLLRLLLTLRIVLLVLLIVGVGWVASGVAITSRAEIPDEAWGTLVMVYLALGIDIALLRGCYRRRTGYLAIALILTAIQCVWIWDKKGDLRTPALIVNGLWTLALVGAMARTRLASGGAELVFGSTTPPPVPKVSPPAPVRPPSPRRILDTRLARGEITPDEYEALRATMEGWPVRPSASIAAEAPER